MGRPLGNPQEQRRNGTVLVLFFFLRGGGELSFGNDLSWAWEHRRPLFRIARYFWTSIKCSGAVSLMFSVHILELTQCVINVDGNVATSLNAHGQARQLRLFQSQGNFCNRLIEVWKQMSYALRKKSMRNVGKIRCEFQTAGYLLWKPHPAAGY